MQNNGFASWDRINGQLLSVPAHRNFLRARALSQLRTPNCAVRRPGQVFNRFFFSSFNLEIAMNKDQVKGRANEAAGKIKETAGKITGNKGTEANGRAEKNMGKVQAGYGDLKEDVKKQQNH
jgi:uncharacterized protein YjbJ (UPF0337 family)